MRTCGLLLGVAVLFSALPASAAEKDADQYIKVEVTGNLKTGLVAIGGETTGTVIATGGISWEVQPGQTDVENLDGKMVTVTGTFAMKPAVELRRPRSIVTATSIKAAGADAKEGAKVEIKGKLATGVNTPPTPTGITITASGATWELELGKDKELQAVAEKNNGKVVVAAGTLEAKKPTSAPPRPRMIVTVTSLKPVEK